MSEWVGFYPAGTKWLCMLFVQSDCNGQPHPRICYVFIQRVFIFICCLIDCLSGHPLSFRSSQPAFHQLSGPRTLGQQSKQMWSNFFLHGEFFQLFQGGRCDVSKLANRHNIWSVTMACPGVPSQLDTPETTQLGGCQGPSWSDAHATSADALKKSFLHHL